MYATNASRQLDFALASTKKAKERDCEFLQDKKDFCLKNGSTVIP